MVCCSDSNNAANQGAASYVSVNMKFLTLPEISSCSQSIDSAWALVEVGNERVIVGSLYVKLNCEQAIDDAVLLIQKEDRLCSSSTLCSYVPVVLLLLAISMLDTVYGAIPKVMLMVS